MLSNATIKDLITAAAEGLRNAESDAKEQIEGADEAVASHTAAIAAAELYLSKAPTEQTNTPTPPIDELRIILSAASYWSTAEADDEHPDPAGDVRELIDEALTIVFTSSPIRGRSALNLKPQPLRKGHNLNLPTDH